MVYYPITPMVTIQLMYQLIAFRLYCSKIPPSLKERTQSWRSNVHIAAVARLTIGVDEVSAEGGGHILPTPLCRLYI